MSELGCSQLKYTRLCCSWAAIGCNHACDCPKLRCAGVPNYSRPYHVFAGRCDVRCHLHACDTQYSSGLLIYIYIYVTVPNAVASSLRIRSRHSLSTGALWPRGFGLCRLVMASTTCPLKVPCMSGNKVVTPQDSREKWYDILLRPLHVSKWRKTSGFDM